MPITTSAQKALRRDRRRTLVNQRVNAAMKTALKQARNKPTKTSIAAAYSAIDRAAKKGVIHKNKAARLKSHLTPALKTKTKPASTSKKTSHSSTKK